MVCTTACAYIFFCKYINTAQPSSLANTMIFLAHFNYTGLAGIIREYTKYARRSCFVLVSLPKTNNHTQFKLNSCLKVTVYACVLRAHVCAKCQRSAHIICIRVYEYMSW